MVERQRTTVPVGRGLNGFLLGLAVLLCAPIISFAEAPIHVAYEYLHPQLEALDETFFSGSHVLEGSHRFGSGTVAFVEIPMSWVNGVIGGSPTLDSPTGQSQSGRSISNFGFGNVELGANIPLNSNEGTIDLSIRLPTSGTTNLSSQLVGLLTDVRRREAFLPSYVSFLGGWNRELNAGSGVNLILRLGGSFGSVITSSSVGTGELWATYRVHLRYSAPKFRLTGGMDGRWAPLDGLNPQIDSQNQLALAAELGDWQLIPSLVARYWLTEDIHRISAFSVGFRLGYSFGTGAIQ